jgi:hypothetical protein
MNCANHADVSAVAYCRTCGKALCANCTRPVRGVIYCEDCLGAKMEGVPSGTAGFVSGGFSATTFPPPASGHIPPILPPPPPASSSGPNPAVAGILAGFFPFGVGAVYTGQYAKGLAHLAIMALLAIGANASDNGHSEALGYICGFGIAFFWIYQVIDAVRSARAIQTAQPIPDPFGLAATFGGGSKIETSKIPLGAIVLILLGVLFLLSTMGLELGLDRFWPIILIALGGWMFARNWGLAGELTGDSYESTRRRTRMAAKYPGYAGILSRCQCTRCRARRMMGPAVLVTLGFLFLFESLGGVSFWHKSWPVLLLVIGGVKLFQSTASAEGHIPFSPSPNFPGGPIPPAPPVPPVPPVPPTSEVNRG